MKKILLLPFMLIVTAVSAEPIVRIVSTIGPDKAFATGNVHKLVLTSTSVDVLNHADSVLLSVPKADIARAEFTEGTPDPVSAVESTLMQNDKAVKIIEHGQVYILRDDRKFTVMGVEVEHNN